MINANKKRILFSATIALSAAMVTPGPAMALYQEDPDAMYDYAYYDGSWANQVGSEYDTCNSWGVGRSALEGVRTDMVWKSFTAYCRNGQLSLT